ncbi:TRAP transporter substrate-binding protein [Chloroflexota bacterium]
MLANRRMAPRVGLTVLAFFLFITPLFIFACAPSSTGTNPGASKPSSDVIELKLSCFDPTPAFSVKGQTVPWAKSIQEATNGRVKITHYSGESLGKAPDQYDMAVSGVCDIAKFMPEMTPGLFPVCEAIQLPGLFPSAEILGLVFHQIINKYAADSELKNVKLLFLPAMPGMMPQSTKQLQKAEDWKGLKNLVEGKVDGMVMETMGASPVPIPMSEVYTALSTGLIDAVNITWEGVFAFKINEATQYRVDLPFYNKSFILGMNKDTWNNLPEDIKAVFDKYCTPEISAQYGAAFDAESQGIIGSLKEYDEKMGNPGIYEMPQAEKDRIYNEILSPIYDKWVSDMEGKIPAKAIIDDIKKLVQQYSK